MIKYLLFQLFGLGVIVFSLSGCFAKKNDFYTYKFPIVNSNGAILLKTDGFYAPESGTDMILFFYKNGLIKVGPWVTNFFSNPYKYFDIIDTDYNTQRWKEKFGCFLIKDSSLIIQRFNLHSTHNPIYRRWVFELRGSVLSDTTFVLNTNFK